MDLEEQSKAKRSCIVAIVGCEGDGKHEDGHEGEGEGANCREDVEANLGMRIRNG